MRAADFLDEMLTLMIAHAQLPAVMRAVQARSGMQRSLVDLRA